MARPHRAMAVYVRTGRSTWEQLELPVIRRRSYLAAWLPTAPGPLVMHMGEPCDPAPTRGSFAYAVALDARGWPTLVATDPFGADALFRNGLAQQDLATRDPMGGAVADLDGDGLPDFVLALNPDHETFAGTADATMRTVSGVPSYLRVDGANGSAFQIPWGAAAVDLDLDGRPDVVFAHGNDPGARRHPELAPGPQDVTVHVNRGGFAFADVTAQAGLGRGQWKALTVDDFDCDGDADLAVGAQDDWPRVYRNDTDAAGHALSLRLAGTTSNALGIGAKVEVWPEGAETAQAAWAGATASPLAFSRPWVFAGLGAATRASRVRVTWPSGYVQEAGALDGGRCHLVVEPQLVEVVPRDRHAAAKRPIELVVSPRTPEGVESKGGVEARVAFGEARVMVSRTATGARVTVTKDAPGFVVVEVSIDGVPLAVRPRLWWD